MKAGGLFRAPAAAVPLTSTVRRESTSRHVVSPACPGSVPGPPPPLRTYRNTSPFPPAQPNSATSFRCGAAALHASLGGGAYPTLTGRSMVTNPKQHGSSHKAKVCDSKLQEQMQLLPPLTHSFCSHCLINSLNYLITTNITTY